MAVEIENLDEVEEMIVNELALFIFKESQKNLIDDGSGDTGFLLGSGKVKKEGKNRVIEYSAPYANIIEEGSASIKVSPKQLEGWIRRKLGIKDPKENKRIGFLISKKLKERGLEGTHFLDRGVQLAKETFKGKSF